MKLLKISLALFMLNMAIGIATPIMVEAAPARFISQSHVRTFGDWEVSLVKIDRTEYIRLASNLIGTPGIFEIMINYNRYWDENRVTFQFYRLVEPGVYMSPDEVKTLGSFMLDEIIYPVDVSSFDKEDMGIYTTLVNDPPYYFMDMLQDTNVLMFRLVSGMEYTISLLGFKEALAYARELERSRWERCRSLLPYSARLTCP